VVDVPVFPGHPSLSEPVFWAFPLDFPDPVSPPSLLVNSSPSFSLGGPFYPPPSLTYKTFRINFSAAFRHGILACPTPPLVPCVHYLTEGFFRPPPLRPAASWPFCISRVSPYGTSPSGTSGTEALSGNPLPESPNPYFPDDGIVPFFLAYLQSVEVLPFLGHPQPFSFFLNGPDPSLLFFISRLRVVC